MADSPVSTNYTILKFDPSIIPGKLFSGKRDGQRRCRFCGRELDETHFKKDAHAISVSLGNTKLFCADECDECNEKFGQKLENDVTQFFQVFLSLYQVPKRNGKEREISGRNFKMKMTEDNRFSSDIPLLRFHLNDWIDENATIDEIIKKFSNLDLSNKTIVPQNIYKAICKYALSLMPHSATLHYQKTIQWIQGDSYETALPKLKMSTFNRNGNEPIMVLFLRKSTSKQYPYCVAFLCIANVHLFYVLPFCDESEGTDQDNTCFDFFWEQFQMLVPCPNGIEYNDADISNANRIRLKIDMDLSIEQGAEPIRLNKDEETGQWVVDNSWH